MKNQETRTRKRSSPGRREKKEAPDLLISNANHFLTTQSTPQERGRGQNPSFALVALV